MSNGALGIDGLLAPKPRALIYATDLNFPKPNDERRTGGVASNSGTVGTGIRSGLRQSIKRHRVAQKPEKLAVKNPEANSASAPVNLKQPLCVVALACGVFFGQFCGLGISPAKAFQELNARAIAEGREKIVAASRYKHRRLVPRAAANFVRMEARPIDDCPTPLRAG